MTPSQRRQKANQGITLLKAVVADVLQKENDGETNLDATDIAELAGFPKNATGDRLSRVTLRLLEIDWKARNELPGSGPGSWIWTG